MLQFYKTIGLSTRTLSIQQFQRALFSSGKKFDPSEPAVVNTQRLVVCWHPPQPHPYEHTLPLSAVTADVSSHRPNNVDSEVLAAEWTRADAVREAGQPPKSALQNMFYTNKHEWWPRLALFLLIGHATSAFGARNGRCLGIGEAFDHSQLPSTNISSSFPRTLLTSSLASKLSSPGQCRRFSTTTAHLSGQDVCTSSREQNTVPNEMADFDGSVVHAEWLGRISYADALSLQRERVKLISESRRTGQPVAGGSNRLYFLEHTPVYTVGIRSDEYSEQEADKLRALGADFVRSERGGLITFHGPGQLVVYPVVDLRDLRTRQAKRIGVRQYVCSMEQVVIGCLAQFGLQASVVCGLHGVWIDDRKIAAIGLKVSHGVCSHGCAINADVDLEWFSHIVPCGIKDKTVTSISQELGRTVKPQQLIDPFCRLFSETFNCAVDMEKLMDIV